MSEVIAMGTEKEPIRPSVFSLAIPSNEIASVEEKALDGDPESANRLVSHYQMFAYDKKSALHWARIAAENGSLVGQYNLGFLLHDDPDPNNRRRAIYWLKRVSKSDVKELAEDANILLDKIKENKTKGIIP